MKQVVTARVGQMGRLSLLGLLTDLEIDSLFAFWYVVLSMPSCAVGKYTAI